VNSSFARTLMMGFAALGVLLTSALATGLVLAKDKLKDRSALRALVLTDEEKAWLAQQHQRAPEPAEAEAWPKGDQDEIIGRIAELANAQRATALISQIKRQQESLDEQRKLLDQRAAEIELSRGDLARLQRQLDAKAEELRQVERMSAEERAKWAKAQAEEAKRMEVVGQVEKDRYRDQAKLFEQMKDNAWQSLRRFQPKEIARYLALMDPKKASRLLVLAQQDQEQPGAALAIHKAMLALDLDARTGDQVERLAGLYVWMPASDVLPYLRQSSADEIAALLRAMAKGGNDKKRAELIEALRQEDPRRELEVRRLLELPPTR
jgi:hypothetical protein